LKNNPHLYVGKGNEGRTRNPERNGKHRHVRKTYGLRREVVFTSDDENDCFRREIELVAEHHTYVHDPLAADVACNFTKGGEGVSGWHPSEETKRKTSETLKVHQRTSEHCANISTGKRDKSVGRGRKQTPETVQKRIETMRQNKANHKSKKGKPMNRLDRQKAIEIRVRFNVNGESARSLAAEFNVSTTTIRNIGKGASYAS
jgi:hypothetical protein